MLKIGLKLWSTNENYFNEAKRLFEEGFYEYIELYAVPDSPRFIDLWKKLNVPYIIHAAHYDSGLNFADNEKKDNNLRLAAQAIRFADELSAEYIIFHPGINGDIEETACQLKQIRDSRILIENKPYLSLDREICIGSRPKEIEYLMKQCGVGCCLDIGHAICAANSHKMDHMAFLKEFIALKPSVYHLTDGDSNSRLDSHRHLGQGNYNLAKLIKVIDGKSYVTLETEKSSQMNLNDFVEDVENLKKWL